MVCKGPVIADWLLAVPTLCQEDIYITSQNSKAHLHCTRQHILDRARWPVLWPGMIIRYQQATRGYGLHIPEWRCHRLRQRPKPLRPVEEDSGSRLKGSPAFPFPASCMHSTCLMIAVSSAVREHPQQTSKQVQARPWRCSVRWSRHLTLLEPAFAKPSKMESRLPALRPVSLLLPVPYVFDPPSSICLLSGLLFLHRAPGWGVLALW